MWPSWYQILQTGKNYISSKMCKNLTINEAHCPHARCSIRDHGCHFSRCKLWRTLALRTPITREHCFTCSFQIVWRYVIPSQHFHCSYGLRGLPDLHLLTICPVPSVTNLSRNLVTVNRFQNSFLQRFCATTTLSVFQHHVNSTNVTQILPAMTPFSCTLDATI